MSRNHQEIAHLWANGSKESARGFNMYFEGRSLYSYGSHYVLGYRMGPGLFFLNSTGYSISTSKHQSYTRRAAFGDVYSIPGLTSYRWELETISGYRTGKRDKAAAQAAFRKMLAALAPAFDATEWGAAVTREAMTRLATESGFTPRQAESLILKADNKAKRDKAQAERKEAAAQRAATLRWANDKTWRAELDSNVRELRMAESDYRRRDALTRIERIASAANKAHRLAGKQGLGPRTVAKLWERAKAYRAALADHRARDAKREELATFRAHAKGLRASVAALAAGDLEPGRAFQHWDALTRQTATLTRAAHVAARPALLGALNALGDMAHAKAQEALAERARREAERQAENVAKWRAGESVPGFYCPSPHGGAMLRARPVLRDESGAIIGGTLETSQGASVPLLHAIRVFRFLKLMRERGETFQRNGRVIRVGHYTVDSVSRDGSFRAGCHSFAWPEIESLAISLGVFDLPPADARELSAAHA